MVRPLRSAVQDAEITPGEPDGKRNTSFWRGPGIGYAKIKLTFHDNIKPFIRQGGQNDSTYFTITYSLFKMQDFTGMHHELNWMAPGHVISRGQDRLEPLPVLVVLTNDRPLPSLLQATVCYWLKGDDAFTILSGFPVDWGAYGCAIWTSYFEGKMSDGVNSNSIFCLTCDLHESG